MIGCGDLEEIFQKRMLRHCDGIYLSKSASRVSLRG